MVSTCLVVLNCIPDGICGVNDQDEIADILGDYKRTNTSFIKGFLYQPSWEGYKFVDR